MYNRLTLATGENEKPKTLPVAQDENQKFGNWTGQGDTKAMAEDLGKRGLVGADQLLFENQDTSSADAIKNKNQSDWKVAMIQNVLTNAKKFGIRTPEALLANKNVLIGNPKWVDAVNNPAFNNIHPNFWSVITKSILPEQWAKYDKSKNQDIAKK